MTRLVASLILALVGLVMASIVVAQVSAPLGPNTIVRPGVNSDNHTALGEGSIAVLGPNAANSALPGPPPTPCTDGQLDFSHACNVVFYTLGMQ